MTSKKQELAKSLTIENLPTIVTRIEMYGVGDGFVFIVDKLWVAAMNEKSLKSFNSIAEFKATYPQSGRWNEIPADSYKISIIKPVLKEFIQLFEADSNMIAV